MRIALFDLDHTVLEGDSDQLWGDFLLLKGLVDDKYQTRKEGFYRDYCAGRLSMCSFIEFCGETLACFSSSQLHELGQEFQVVCLSRHLRPKAIEQIAWHRSCGDCLVLISATNHFLVELSAALLDISNVIATQLATQHAGAEMNSLPSRILPKMVGTPAYQAGKVSRINAWLANRSAKFDSTIAYSDSHNDLPLLQWADQAIAVNPDPQLYAQAKKYRWKILDWQHSVSKQPKNQTVKECV